METGARVWISDSESEDAWLLCEIAKKTDSELVATHVDDSSRSITRNRTADTSIVKYQGVELANAPLSEEEKKEGRDDDLITLPHLHEPAILHAVNERFMLGKIYTWTGPVLIAVNPFQRLPLYTRELLQAYRQEGLLRSQGLLQKAPMGPHIYSIADRSYRQMMSTGRSGVKKSQAILISGESGAGKTESTKIVMLYLTTLGSDNEHAHAHENAGAAGTDTMERVLQSNPILEAFGNARTLRNDNSSRFGKFIELGFSRAGMLLGARVDTYLLEKVRLGFHASGERNYHIFYQLLRGATPEQQQKFHFYEGHTGGLELCNYFHYTGQGGAPHLREFTDEEGLAYTIKAMKRMAWSEDKVDTVLKLIAGLLHLGQMTFSTVDVNGEEAASIEQQSTLEYAAELIGVDQSLLQSALTQRIMEARGERMTLVLSPARALDARDALSKTIYGALFLWVVQQVNDNIMWPNDKDKTNSIGVLDIFGFECFAINSFEQLCINFTNEALQQQFNKFIFKMEQAEYEREQIEWQFIDFPDNQDCLDLIQSRPNGLLAMLDDECRLPKGSDRNWANRLYKEHLSTDKKVAEDENGRFFATAIQKSKAIFCVRHFAGKVAYTAETGFLEKNRDEIPLAAKNLLENAPNQLIRDIYSIQLRESEVTSTSSSGKSKTKSRTVGMQFKDQLLNLMAKVETTEPHYIRCLKPNDKAKPLMLVRARLTEQLRYGGVLEAVRVARMGYPVRLGHAEFFRRYRMVLPGNNAIPWSTGMDDSEHPATGNTSAQSLCIQLVDAALADAKIPFSEKYGSNTLANRIRRSMKAPEPMDFPRRDVQLGLSKVFLRKPPHDQLESHRTFHQNVSVTVVQTFIRTAQLRRAHLVSGHAVGIIQRWYRGCLGRAAWWKLKEQVSAALLNKVLRMWTQYSRFTRAKNGTVRLQGAIRGRNVRRSNAATRIQTQVRMVQKRRPYVALLSAIISLQCALRCRVARQVYGSLRAEQKDIGKLKRNNEQLKNEMASLRAMLKAQAESQANNAGHAEALQSKENDLKVLEGRVKVLEQMLAAEKEKVSQLEKQIQVKDAESQSAMDVLEEKLNQAIGDRDAALEARDSARSAATAASAAAAASASISAQMVQQMSPPSSPRRVSTMTTTTPQAAALQPEPTIVAIPPPPDLSDNNDLPLPPKSPRSPVANAAAAIVTNAAAAIGLVNASTATAATKTVTVSAEDAAALAQFEAHIARLEQELKKERLAHSTAQKEVKQLKTQLSSSSNTNGDAGPAKGLRNSMRFMKERINSAVNVTTTPPPNNSKDASGSSSLSVDESKVSITPVPPRNLSQELSSAPASQTASNNGAAAVPNKRVSLLRSPSDYFPMVRRGGTVAGKADDEGVGSVWKSDVMSRREREENIADEVKKFEMKSQKYKHMLEEGSDATLWQLHRNENEEPEFVVKSVPVTFKLDARGDSLVQKMLCFSARGGMLSKALGRGDRNILEPISLHDVLDVKPGCVGYESVNLPVPKSKTGRSSGNAENKHSSLFMTICGSPSPIASSRLFFVRFKTRTARNEAVTNLRRLLAELQVKEGVTISSIHNSNGAPSPGASPNSQKRMANLTHGHHNVTEMPALPALNDDENAEDILVPLSVVQQELDKERESYDRLLILLLSGSADIKDKEDELLALRGKMDGVTAELKEKNRVQANDSKLIMQLSKKLEMLLMDNEDLRDQNDRLNTRLVQYECEKMNLMS